MADIDHLRSMALMADTPLYPESSFITLVNTGGDWDYKQQGDQYVDFGNFNFGATCNELGHTLYYCQSGAGTAHVAQYARRLLTGHKPLYGGEGFLFIKPPYGDQRNDSIAIAAGYAYAEFRRSCGP
jgi:Bacterial toxin 44